MGDEFVFEGDDSSEFVTDTVKDLDLFSIANNTKNFWKLKEVNPYHLAIDILIGKGLSYDSKTKIMNHISNALGKREITKQNWVFKDQTMKNWGLSNEKIEGIRKILSMDDVNINSLCKIKEGGIYLVKSYKVLAGEDDDTFLYEDYNVLKNMGIIFARDKMMTNPEAMKISKNWVGYRSMISYFLYRLKPESAIKILDEDDLLQTDFLGF